METSIRFATVQDSKFLATLVGQMGYPAETEEMENRLKLILSNSDYGVFVSQYKGKIIGMKKLKNGLRLMLVELNLIQVGL